MTFSPARNVVALAVCALFVWPQYNAAQASPLTSSKLAGHKAVYEIHMTGNKIGSQVIGVNGKLLYSARPSCDGWITDHQFLLTYEYTGTPRVDVDTKLASFETYDGSKMTFSSIRRSNGEILERIRGSAELPQEKKNQGAVRYVAPEDISYDLSSGTLFPIAHTQELIAAAEAGKKVFHANVFDGGEGKGADEINAIIGRAFVPLQTTKNPAKNIDAKLLAVPGWDVRLAVFPVEQSDSNADYELNMTLLANGVIKDMNIDYHDFTVSQKLVALEKINAEKCGE